MRLSRAAAYHMLSVGEQQVNISPRLSEPTTIVDYRHVWELVRVDEVRGGGLPVRPLVVLTPDRAVGAVWCR